MEMGLEGKTALVTGASSEGIGRAIAKGLAAEGVQLCITARRRQLLDELAEEIRKAGGKKPHVVSIDLLEEGGPQKLAQEALAKLGSIGILVNAAGGGGGYFGLNASEESWEREANFNFSMQRKLMLAVVPDMLKHKWGRILSITGKLEPPRELKCDPPMGIFGATAFKAAMHGFSKSLSNEVGRYGITVNCLSPGKIMSEQIRRKHNETERNALAQDEIPVGRYGEPEELARLAVFLASPYSGFITGTIMMVDGGMRRFAF
jgi:3-oxoacyl-[acyl-carrier protein] reductase